MANNGIYYSSGHSLSFTTSGITWATLTSGGTFLINTVSGGTYLNLPQSVSGNGLVNYIAKWTGTTGLATSLIYDTGTFVGVGKTSPSILNSQFGVSSAMEIDNVQFTVRGNSFGITDTDLTSWQTNGNEIAIGYGSPLANSQGNDNIAIGYTALQSNASGNNNIALGKGSLILNQAGEQNIAIGNDAGSNITSGSQNIAIGYGSLAQTDVGGDNIAIGDQAGEGNTSGSANVYIGLKTGEVNSGSNNTIIGATANQAGSSDTSVFLGYAAGFGATSNNSVFIGPSAGYNETSNQRLHIANTTTKTLIYGEFDNNLVKIGGTISATTYQNLPGSSSLNCFTTFYVTNISGCSPVNLLSPLNITNGANFTGTTTFQGPVTMNSGFTASTFSATTYQNLPTDVFVSAGTYSNGQITFTNTTGGTFNVTNIPIGGAGGQPYYINLSQTQTPYQEFAPSATTAAEQTTGVTINSGVTTTISSFLTPAGYPNVTLIPAGVWTFYLHSYKANSSTTFDIFVEVYKRTTGGTETLLVSTDPAEVTNIGVPSMEISDTYYSGTSLNISDRILIKVRATNTGTASSTVTFVTEGTDHYSYGVTPFTNTSNVNSVSVSDGLSGNSSTGTISIINTDKGSSQNIFKNIQVNGATQFSAGSNSSNLNFSGINITIISAATNTLVFSAGTGGGGAVSSITAGSGLSGNSTTGAITLINTQVQGITGITASSGISASTSDNVVTLINTGVTGITAGSNISINQSTGNVTISSTGGGGGASLGTVYTTANNFNFL